MRLRRRGALLPVVLALSGCSVLPESGWVDAHNHTDEPVRVRAADQAATCPRPGRVTIAPGGRARIAVRIVLFDAGVVVEDADGRERRYDLDVGPFGWCESLHLLDEPAPSGNG
jgi:hypothetical protein